MCHQIILSARYSFSNSEYIGWWWLWAMSLSGNCPWLKDSLSLKVMCPYWAQPASSTLLVGVRRHDPMTDLETSLKSHFRFRSLHALHSKAEAFGVTAPQFNFSLCKILLPSRSYMHDFWEHMPVTSYMLISVSVSRKSDGSQSALIFPRIHGAI